MPRAARRSSCPERWRRVAVAWLLVVGLTGVLGVARAQAAASEHACCRKAPVRAATPPSPCSSLLPLACCHATVLPATAHHASDLGGPVLAEPAPVEPTLSTASLSRADAHASARVSPHPLSVVLRL